MVLWRGKFTLSGIAFLLFFFAATDLSRAQEGKADLVLFKGKVITVDNEDSIAQGVAVKNGKIIKVGSNEEILALVGAETEVLDLRGKTVTPGLVDSHNHLMYYGRDRKYLMNVRPPMVKSEEDLLKLVGEKAKELPKGEWIAGGQGFYMPKDEAPGRWELDRVAPDNPVYLPHVSGQYVVANSYALELSGIDKYTPNPFRGVIEKDPVTGEPTGLLFHYPTRVMVAKHALAKLFNVETWKDSVRHGAAMLIADGITSAHDVIVFRWEHTSPYRTVASAGELPVRMYLMVYVSSLTEAKKLGAMAQPFREEMVRFGGWKIAVDGGPAAGTTLMYDATLPGAEDSYLFHTQEELNDIVAMYHKEGYQVAFHVVGDRAVDMALNSLEFAQSMYPRKDPRHRLEHVVFPTQRNLQRIKELGAIVSTTPQWIYDGGAAWPKFVGIEATHRAIPLRTMLDMGIPVAFGSDVPATFSHKPQFALWAAVTRKTRTGQPLQEKERITIREALRIHTMGGAYAAFEEGEKGSIEVGKVADFAVWSEDLYSTPEDQIKDLRVELTIVGGRIVYQSDKSSIILQKGKEYLR